MVLESRKYSQSSKDSPWKRRERMEVITLPDSTWQDRADYSDFGAAQRSAKLVQKILEPKKPYQAYKRKMPTPCFHKSSPVNLFREPPPQIFMSCKSRRTLPISMSRCPLTMPKIDFKYSTYSLFCDQAYEKVGWVIYVSKYNQETTHLYESRKAEDNFTFSVYTRFHHTVGIRECGRAAGFKCRYYKAEHSL